MSEYDWKTRGQRMIEATEIQHPGKFQKAIEIGCGTGKITSFFLPKCEKLLVTDISAKLSNFVGSNLGLEWAQADATNLPFQDSQFDLVFSSECIEHTPSPVKSIQEMIRVAKPGALIVITTPNKKWYPLVRLSQISRLRRFQGNEKFMSHREIKRTISSSRAEIVFMSGCHLFPWQIPLANKLLHYFDRFGNVLYPLMINLIVICRKEK